MTEFIRRRRERREEAEETETDRMETPLIEVDISGEECNICREDRIIIKLECHEEHKVCINCVRRINECPYCRERINKITIRNKIIEIGMREENEERGNIILKSVGFNDQEIRLLRIA